MAEPTTAAAPEHQGRGIFYGWYIVVVGVLLMAVVFGTIINIFSVFVPLVRSVLMPSIGWSSTYLVIGAVQAVLIPLVLLVLRSTPEQKGRRPYGWTARAEARTPGDSVRVGLTQRQVYRTASFWLMGVALIFSGISVNGMISVLDPMLLAMTAPEDVVVLVLTTAGLFVVLGKLCTGWLFDHASVMLTIVIVAAANTAQFFFMLSPTTQFKGLMFALLHGFGATMVTVTPAYLTAKLFGDRDYPAVFGTVSIFINTGMVVAAPFGLPFYDGVSGKPGVLVWAWMGAGLLGLLFYIGTVLLRPKWAPPSDARSPNSATARA